MTPKEIKQYCKDEVIKKYLLKNAKSAIGFDDKNSVEKFKALKILLEYSKGFRFDYTNAICCQTCINIVIDTDEKRMVSDNFYIKFILNCNAVFVKSKNTTHYFSEHYFSEMIKDIVFIESLVPVIIV